MILPKRPLIHIRQGEGESLELAAEPVPVVERYSLGPGESFRLLGERAAGHHGELKPPGQLAFMGRPNGDDLPHEMASLASVAAPGG